MSYPAVYVVSKFTSTAGESTTDEINKIVTSLSSTIYDLANDVENHKSILSGFSQVMQDALLEVWEDGEAEYAVENEDPQSLCSSLHDLIRVSGDRIILSANSEEETYYTLLEPLLLSLLPLMKEQQTTVVTMINDSRDGISSHISVVSKDGTMTNLDEFLASSTLVVN